MIRKQLEKNPEDPGMWGYLGDDYYARGNLEEAEKAYKKAIELYPESIPFEDQRARWTFVSILRLFGERQREGEMYDYFFAAKSVFPQEADFDFIVGRYQFQKNNYEQALEHLTTCISLLEETEQEDSGSYAVANIASVYEALAFSCYYLGEIKAAIRFASVLLSADHESVPGISVFMLCFRDLEGDEKENAAYCLLALRKFEDLKRPEDAAHMLLAAKRTGYTRMQELLEQKIPANVRKTVF
jgi:tetratricopeptide (TPR) repeat protein